MQFAVGMDRLKNTHELGLMAYVMLCSFSLLVVQGAPTAKDRNEPQNGTLQVVWFSSTPSFITVGQRKDLECYFSGWPFPSEVHWFKDDQIITNGTEGIYHSEVKRGKNGEGTLCSRLILPPGREELEGFYKCRAKNSFSEVSVSLQLIYVCPRPGSPTVVSGKESESKSSNVSLACLIDYGWACPQRLFWTLNNTAHLSERAEKYEIQVKDTQSKCKKEFILSIFNVTEHDEGTYSCHWQCKYSGSMEAAIDLKITDEPQIGA